MTWPPPPYDPQQHHQRITRPQPQPQFTPQSPPPPGPAGPGYGYAQPPQHRRRSRAPLAVIAAAVVIIGGGTAYTLTGHHAAAQSPASAAEPDTAAGVRAAATAFYALYSAGQWSAAWNDLSPAGKASVSRPVYIALHQACPPGSAGMARVIKGITLDGTTAVVRETVAGSLGSLGTVADAWTYTGGRWSFSPDAASMAVYAHGSAKADIAAAKAAGDC